MDGGSFGLLGLIRDHRGAVEYDLRQRFGFGLRDVGERVSLFELARLVVILRADPSSMVAAALEGWAYPVSRTDLILMDHYDLAYAATGAKNRKPYNRPFKVAGEQKQRGKPRPYSEAAEILNRYGHNIPV